MSTFIQKFKNSRYKNLLIVLIVFSAFLLGYFISPHSHETPQPLQVSSSDQSKAASEHKHSLWTCSMHPQIKLPNPGKCPICFMDLVPLASDAGPAGSDIQFVMSEEAKRLAQVETVEVKREQAKVPVRMLGLVYEDETRVAVLTSRVDGRLDEVYINFTGVQVKQGDPMVKIWSPTLIKSQVELFETIRSENEPAVVKGAEEKLLQLGLTKEQIDEIRIKKKPDLYVTLRAPISGIVTKKSAVLGQFVKEGSEMYTINDLSHVWVKLDAYEPDLPWIKYGQDVTFTTPAIPGKKFKGRVLFIDPVLDLKTRSVKVRVDAENPELLLKPGMFVSAEIESEVDAQGRVIKKDWIGKYICPIHPRDIVSDTPGLCPDSKMEMRPASSFGYSDDPNPKMPLVIPVSAPLITGKRTIVYVEVPGDKPTYELREIVLGPRAGDKYLVYEGLKEGERVVTKGNFKIDSAMQILGKPSMMSDQLPKPPVKKEEVVSKLRIDPDFRKQLRPILEEYFTLKDAFASGNVQAVSSSASALSKSLEGIDKAKLDESSTVLWDQFAKKALLDLKSMAENTELSKQLSSFDSFSEALAKIVMSFRHNLDQPMYLYFCEAASGGNGAYWLEKTKEFKNPYFTGADAEKGVACSELQETIPPDKQDHQDSGSQKTAHPHEGGV